MGTEVRFAPEVSDSDGVVEEYRWDFGNGESSSETGPEGFTVSPDPAGVEFEKPVLVGIHFKLEGPAQYLQKSCLRAYYYNYEAGNWELIPASYVDPENDIVYFLTRHFSMFSVQASVAPALVAGADRQHGDLAGEGLLSEQPG